MPMPRLPAWWSWGMFFWVGGFMATFLTLAVLTAPKQPPDLMEWALVAFIGVLSGIASQPYPYPE